MIHFRVYTVAFGSDVLAETLEPERRRNGRWSNGSMPSAEVLVIGLRMSQGCAGMARLAIYGQRVRSCIILAHRTIVKEILEDGEGRRIGSGVRVSLLNPSNG